MLSKEEYAAAIENGETALGLELGSTRIKAVLIGPDHEPIASGAFDWENRLENGVWTYHLNDVWAGLQAAFKSLKEDAATRYGVQLRSLGALGVSAMMHGYLAFDAAGNQLAEFRTWRNTITEAEAAELTELFGFNIPQRWSIAHLWRAVKNKEPHVGELAHLTTLAGYVHWKLSGQRVLGVGEAAGMFPIDSETKEFHAEMIQKFDALLEREAAPFRLHEIFPTVLTAGEAAGTLTAEGAKLLDPTGDLAPGAPLCPPEGDAGTGMVATNSVAPRTGNVSAGTSIFAMVVLERPLKQLHTEIDMVTTPSGEPVAMVHCNTCTSDLDAWVRLFGQALEAAGVTLSKSDLYELLYKQALLGNADCGGLISYNCYSGEPVTNLQEGRPMVVRNPESVLSLPNFMRAQLYAAMATLQIGMDILFEDERVTLEKLYGHGGLFKTRDVGQQLMAGALNVPVAVLETAGEGGPWGMALLAMYRKGKAEHETLESYLAEKVFGKTSGSCVQPESETVEGFRQFIARYKQGLAVERLAGQLF